MDATAGPAFSVPDGSGSSREVQWVPRCHPAAGPGVGPPRCAAPVRGVAAASPRPVVRSVTGGVPGCFSRSDSVDSAPEPRNSQPHPVLLPRGVPGSQDVSRRRTRPDAPGDPPDDEPGGLYHNDERLSVPPWLLFSALCSSIGYLRSCGYDGTRHKLIDHHGFSARHASGDRGICADFSPARIGGLA